jgi:tetratricopeptide (TPR) repeat protein
MFKTITIISAMVFVLCPLSSPLMGQSSESARRLHEEGYALQEKASSKEDLKKAAQKYEEALSIYRKIGNVKGEWQILMNLGKLYWVWGQYAKAVEHYEIALEIARKIGDVKVKGNSLMGLGIVYDAWGQYTKAVEYFERTLEIAKKIRDVKVEGSTLTGLGGVYFHLGQYTKAAEYFEKSLEIARKIHDVKVEEKALGNLGNVYLVWGQYAKALEYYEKALQIARKIHDVNGEGNDLMSLGNVYDDWGQYTKAVEYFEKSLEINRKIGDVNGEGNDLGNLGNVYKDCGQYAKAVEYYEKALGIERKIHDVAGEGNTLTNLGNVYKDWGQYAKAVEYFEKALEINRKIGNLYVEGETLMGLGSVYYDWGQHTKAVEYYDKSLGIRRKIGDVNGEGATLTNLGKVYHHRGEHDKALASFQKGMEIYVKIGVPAGKPNDLIGNLYIDKGELAKAEPFIKQANLDSSLGRLSLAKADYPSSKNSYESLLKSAEQNRNANNLFAAYAGLGMSYECIGDNLQAVEYYRKAVLHTEDLRSSLNPGERETFFDVRIGGFYRTSPYEGLARVLAKMNRPVEAFKESEYARARIFAESISKRSEYAGLDVPKDIRDKDSQLTDELAALTKNLQKAYEKQNKEQIAVLEPQVKEAKQKLSAHVDMLRKQHPLFAATRYPQPMDLKETALQDNEWVLAYHVTDPGIIIYLTKGKNLIRGLFKPIPRKDVAELVRKFRSPMELGSNDSFAEKLGKFDFGSGKKLSDLLLSDILPDIPKNTPLIIIPDSSLGVVPFEMLVLNDAGKIVADNKRPQTSGAEFFGDRNPISYYQSITALTLERTLGKQKKTQDKLLVIADPVFEMKDARTQENGPSTKLAGSEARLYEDLMTSVEEGKVGGLRFGRLPLTGNLAENLNTAFKGSCTLYTGLKANKGAFIKDIAPNLSDYSKVVFATHGYFGKGLPGINEPVLVFTLVPPGTDGYIRMSEVMGLKMNADMVALTACQTGLGRNISGEGTMGMGRAFQYAGAKSVLMSLWSVAEGSSVDLVESFFRHIKEGKNKLEALKLARDEIRKQGYDHPFFWASFILVGEAG